MISCMLQRHCLAIYDLQVWTEAETGAVQQDAFQELACWACDGRPTDVKVDPMLASHFDGTSYHRILHSTY